MKSILLHLFLRAVAHFEAPQPLQVATAVPLFLMLRFFCSKIQLVVYFMDTFFMIIRIDVK